MLGFCVETATFVTRKVPELPQPTRAANNTGPTSVPMDFGNTGTEHTPTRTPVEDPTLQTVFCGFFAAQAYLAAFLAYLAACVFYGFLPAASSGGGGL